MNATLRLVALLALILTASCPAAAATLIVDPGHPQAADTNPGTEQKPFKAIQPAVNAAKPGDTVCVMEGLYEEQVTVKASGAEGRMITLRALPRHGALLRSLTLEDASYVRIEGFRIVPVKPEKLTVLRLGSGHHLEAVDNRIEDAYLGIAGSGPNVTLLYNKIYKTQQGLNIRGNQWRVENNEIERVFQHASGDSDYSRVWGRDHVLRYNAFHNTLRPEVGTAHLDCLQSYGNKADDPNTVLANLTFERNYCQSFSQTFMIETKTPGTYVNYTLRYNVVWDGTSGFCASPVPGCKIDHNTFAKIKWYGIRNTGGQGSDISDNLFHAVGIPYTRYTAGPQFTGKNNLIYNMLADEKSKLKSAPEGEYVEADPKLADPEKGNLRLTRDSPAVDAGSGKSDVGALEYPNVYWVDPRHPAASDAGFGYSGRPFKTLARAMAIAEPGETVLLRGGLYREALVPQKDGLTIKALQGEKVILSGADLLEGWKRGDSGSWTAPLAAEPKTLLRDGAKWTEFSYDAAARTITLTTGGDPRLHVFETVIRDTALILGGHKDLVIDSIAIENVSGPQITGAENAKLTSVSPAAQGSAK